MNYYEKLNSLRVPERKRLRVGAYCRVSTDKEDQANSFESQQKYFREYIERKPEWELYEIFADEGITGTNTKKRKEFNRMIMCAKNGEIDLIITKEISRFARNTLDSIYYTRELKKIGVGVIFLNDNINTLDSDAELRLTIMSSIAQEESRKTSERVKWGQKRRMEEGIVFGRDMLGYDVKNGVMHINEDGAKIVRLIFDKFVNENKGTHVIARELREAGIKTSTYKTEWSNTVILKILRNEKYCGDLVQKKTFTPDYLSHEKKYNHGEEEFIIIKNHHEPIIERDIFEKANEILQSRALSPEGKSKHSNRYAFSGKIKCGKCGRTYVSRYKTRKDKSKYKLWRCYEATIHGSVHIDSCGNTIGCDNSSVRDEELMYVMQLVCKSLNTGDMEFILNNLLNIIKNVILADSIPIDVDKLNENTRCLQEKSNKLLDLYIDGNITKEEFIKSRDKYDNEIKDIQDIIQSIGKQKMIIEKQDNLIKEIESSLKKVALGIESDGDFYREILDKIVIVNKDKINVFLKLLPYKWEFAISDVLHTQKKVQRLDNTGNNTQSVILEAPLGTEELAHLEMVATIVHQLTRNMCEEDIKKSGFDSYFVDHTAGVYPIAASGVPYDMKYIGVKGDVLADLHEDLAADAAII